MVELNRCNVGSVRLRSVNGEDAVVMVNVSIAVLILFAIYLVAFLGLIVIGRFRRPNLRRCSYCGGRQSVGKGWPAYYCAEFVQTGECSDSESQA